MTLRKNISTAWISVVVFYVLIVGLSAGCGGGSEQVGDAEIERAKASLQPFKKQLGAALKEGLRDGPENAVWVCRDKVPEIAAALTRDGIEIGRTSHRVRNPANAPQPWMEPLLVEYIDRGDDRTPRVLRLEDGSIGYVEPIYVQPLCLQCHGGDIPAPLESRIAELYPSDAATGFASGDFRGLFWVRLAPVTPKQ
jgi:hypothetical protein